MNLFQAVWCRQTAGLRWLHRQGSPVTDSRLSLSWTDKLCVGQPLGACEMNRKEVWRLDCFEPGERLHLAGCLCQIVFSSFMSPFLSVLQESFSVQEKSAHWLKSQIFYYFLSPKKKSCSPSYSIYLVSLSSRRGQHFFTKCYCKFCHIQYSGAV